MKPEVRVGIGFDFHPFAEGRDLFLGGIKIRNNRGLAGHSDADVLVHAVIDALLGAAGLGDIGTFFPDTDPRYRGARSLDLLKDAYALVREREWLVGNLDVVLIAEEPRIASYAGAIRSALAPVLEVPADDIGIKGTTMEGRGPIGRGEGVAAQAAVLLFREP